MTGEMRPSGHQTIVGRGIARARGTQVVAALAALLAVACGGDGGAPTATPAPTGAPGTVAFLPTTIALDNPTAPGERTAGGTFAVEVVAYDASGRAFAPSADSPLTVAVYGAPQGAITPASTTITSGSSATFSYDGTFFPVPMTLAAWIDQPAGTTSGGKVARAAAGAAAGRSFGRAQLLHANPPDCAYGSASWALPLVRRDGAPASAEEALEHGLEVEAAVGWADPSDAFAPFQVDTGSVGVLVPYGDVGGEALDTGKSGVQFYDSSGNTYAGRYFMAPVSFRLADGSVLTTPPIKVLGVESAYCAPGYPKCHEHPPSPTIHYLGVGFDRRGTATDDGLDLPADNVFLQAAGASSAGDVSPGYVLSTAGVTLGITSTDGFALEKLAANAAVPSDWSTAAGCFAFPAAPAPNQFCGTLLLDVGITGMFLALPRDERPAGFVDDSTSPPTVPRHKAMEITVGSASASVLSYSFTVSDDPAGPAPTKVTWVESLNVFVNVGRRPLAAYDYLYDARCGNVGFKALD